MRVNKILQRLLFVIVIILIIFFVVKTYLPNDNIISNEASYIEPIPIPPVISQALQNLIEAQSQGNVSLERSSSNFPVRLIIPTIKVDALVEYVGLTPDGAMDVPKGPVNVAWFHLGPIPGEKGSAVIAGHYGWKNDIPAVFDDLYKLKIGDKIYTVDNLGATSTFVVGEIGTYDKNEDAINVFSSNDGKAHLNLITCQGIWNVASNSRPNRLVIFTNKE